MKTGKLIVAAIAACLSTVALAANTVNVTDTKTYTAHLSIGKTAEDTWTVSEGGAILVNPANANDNYIELCKEYPSTLILNGGTITSATLAFRASENSFYQQKSGTATLMGGNGLLFDGGKAEISGGVCNANKVYFRYCTSAALEMTGGQIIVATSFGGEKMGNADITFALSENYAYTDSDEGKFAITVTGTTLINQAPKSLTITGDPVEGCEYALIDGLADDVFYTAITPSGVPEGWTLERRGQKLLLAEKTVVVAKAVWTGKAGDGNPLTSGNWECTSDNGEFLDDALPKPETICYVPEDATNFVFPAGKTPPMRELHFLGDTYTLNADADWSGLTAGLVTRWPKTIDVNGNALTLINEPISSGNTDDLTKPDGNIVLKKLDGTVLSGNNYNGKMLLDGIHDAVTQSSSRILVAGNPFPGCFIDYDFGEGEGTVVRGLRFFTSNRDGKMSGATYTYKQARRPKTLYVYGTMDDPADSGAQWTQLDGDAFTDLDLAQGNWTDYLTFSNEVPYRGYRVKITDVAYPEESNTYRLELLEMEFISTPANGAGVTSGVEGGELHFNVPANVTRYIAHTAISGDVKIVKEGAGMLGFEKANQTFTGGVEVKGGTIIPTDNQGVLGPRNWVFGGYPTENTSATTVTLHGGATLDLNGYSYWGNMTVVLDGGTVSGYTTSFDARTRLTASSYLKTVYNGSTNFTIPNGADFDDLNGQTLKVDIASGKNLYLNLPRLSNGSIDVRSGGTFTVRAALDAQTVNLTMGAALNLLAGLSVSNYVAKYTQNSNSGTAAFNVYGTFMPETDYFYGCTLQDGAKIDLSAKTDAWSTTSKFTGGSKTVAFADGATVFVDLGTRTVRAREKIIDWTGHAPANLGTLKFKLASGQGGMLRAREDGLYRVCGSVILIW